MKAKNSETEANEKKKDNPEYYPRRILNKKRNLNYRAPEDIQEYLENNMNQNESFLSQADPFQVISPKVKNDFNNHKETQNFYPSTFNYGSFG